MQTLTLELFLCRRSDDELCWARFPKAAYVLPSGNKYTGQNVAHIDITANCTTTNPGMLGQGVPIQQGLGVNLHSSRFKLLLQIITSYTEQVGMGHIIYVTHIVESHIRLKE